MMANTRADPLSLHLDDKLTHLSGAHFECYIYKVHDRLRRQNEMAYEPEILAVGPYHHGKGNLRMMEEHKLRYLKLLLERTNETSVDRYIVAMRILQERAQRCYSDSIRLNKDEFVEMMLLDSCFVIELLRKFTITSMRDMHDPIFKMDWILHSIWRDLMLFENQLPFFVLVQMFNMTKVPDPRDNIIDLVIRYFYLVRKQYFCGNFPELERFLCASYQVSADDVKHFLGLVHHATTSFAKLVSQRNVCDTKTRWDYIYCATELHEAGIKFKKAKYPTLVDVKFINGTLEIPELTVEEKTECIFRNMIAHEEHLQDTAPKYVTDYLTFLCCLINSPKDVSLLRRCGILNNMLGEDEAVAAMFSRAVGCVFVSRDDFFYYDVFINVKAYCRQRWNMWKAKLRRDYFNSPWTIISFLGVVLLLLLTVTQTVLSILAYSCQK
ncbi:UPF0481 protein At3g47200-like [Actinidia eriantha]|uniref:UPF0481 protein At3g47200-like n=1 Tax=Actinidia eriantha TaxID=165200 RepID=UPI00258C9AD9|nr:UPF0481 protein At3g47200-like [Actinidia eriantha]XP_057470676.1 UPF0481 protein At3g47200-like [Actinidia eriantha]XP_057470677.1 UPF0481 protein At3g47200-like [Actinidia eriantha]